jgi:hypothetical protein
VAFFTAVRDLSPAVRRFRGDARDIFPAHDDYRGEGRAFVAPTGGKSLYSNELREIDRLFPGRSRPFIIIVPEMTGAD